MHLFNALAAVAITAPFVAAGPAIPRLAGLNVRDLKARNMLTNMFERADLAAAEHHEARGIVESRQNTDGQCGPGFGSCAPGYCCSQEGLCGQGPNFCFSPGCQYNYGPACPDNTMPSGTSLASVPRTKVGAVPYGGGGVYECTRPGDVAITFEDGPVRDYTSHILDILRSYNARATFFVTGNNLNKGQIDTTPAHTATIQRAYAEGHQIASHTWTHLDLSAISSTDRKNQMYKNEMALRNILGFFPTYMRPPYDTCSAASGCEKDMADLGYHIIYYNLDPLDQDNNTPQLIQNSKNKFRSDMTAGGATPANAQWLAMAHDTEQQTAYNLTDYMLSTLTSLGYRAVTVGECLRDPAANWYRTGAGTPIVSSSSVVPSSTPSSSAGVSSSASSVAVSSSASSVAVSSSASSAAVSISSSSTVASSSSSSAGISSSSSPAAISSSISSAAVSSASSSAAISSSISSTAILASSSSAAISSSASSIGVSSSSLLSSTPAATSSAPSALPTKKVTPDATCGGTNGYTCQGSVFGNCCSINGWCGSTRAYCGTGCQPGFGTCTGTSSSSVVSSTLPSASAAPSPAKKVSTDATCGGTKGFTCQGSSFGNCCSKNNWCGSTSAYCGTGCQSAFGTCSGTGVSSAPPVPTKKVTTDATCGGSKGFTCQGSSFGNCCSKNGWCGVGSAYCGNGCQRNFGTCS